MSAPVQDRGPVSVYLPCHDLSLPKGPSVNEREFWTALGESGLEHVCVMPRPSRDLPDLPLGSAVVYPRSSHKFVGMFYSDQKALLACAGKVIEDLQAKGRDIRVVVRLPFLPWSIAALMRRFPEAPFFVKSLGDTEFLRRSTGLRRLLSRPLWRLQTRVVGRVLARAAAIDTPTDKLKAYLVRHYPIRDENVAVIPNATNAVRFDPASVRRNPSEAHSEQSLTLGYVGGYPFARGGRQIVEVMANLRDQVPGLRCIIAGGDEALLGQHAQRYQVSERCRIAGRVPYEQVPDLLAQIDLVIATDSSARSKELGNSNQKIRQALAMGIPVVSNTDCERFLLDNGLVWGTDTDDIDALSAQVLRFCRMPLAEREAFARRARHFVIENLSTQAALARRLRLWKRQSEKSPRESAAAP